MEFFTGHVNPCKCHLPFPSIAVDQASTERYLESFSSSHVLNVNPGYAPICVDVVLNQQSLHVILEESARRVATRNGSVLGRLSLGLLRVKVIACGGW